MRKTLFIVLLILIIISSAVFAIYKHDQNKKDKEFLSKLKGEVVFTRRDKSGVSDIWKINANKTGEVMLFHNEKDKTRTSFPCWSLSEDKIYFFLYDLIKKEKQIYEMNTDGTNVKLAENPDRDPEYVNRLKEKDEGGVDTSTGDLFLMGNGQKKLIYDAKYDGKFNTGVSDVSWGHDKKYLIFVDNRYTILIADTNGKVSKLTSGSEPDWKY
ncbi:hypothetical protein L6278_00680 [Candidatus Parcubacteria bacterium]|nr:hypothetical protein [Patescibacteria group bacterium]MBU4482193.1 hypothetical protein [Patescibacteria group bacterium]MCG2686634.1 hypothetical protein [Candidatus Parcubacteria bacterium]